MKKETVDELLETCLEEEYCIMESTNIDIYTDNAIFNITQFESDVEIHKLEDSIQINKQDRTILISYEAIQIMVVS